MQRDVRIDFLRGVAILLIIFAHVSPPNLLFQIRIFDVPLMALLLGASFALSQKGKKLDYCKYLKKRFKRLIVPAFKFLTIFFIFVFCISKIVGVNFPYDWKEIILSYTLISGIGYVWIIRVFFTIAIISPFLYRITMSLQSFKSQAIAIFILCIIQEIICFVSDQLGGIPGKLFSTYIAISFGYCLMALVGMWSVTYTKKENYFIGIGFLIIFVLVGWINGFPNISIAKYPPSLYFIAYGMGISLLLLGLSSALKLSNLKFLFWLSRYSLEIYYWHIFMLFIVNNAIEKIQFESSFLWILKYIVILLGSILGVFCQKNFISFMKKKKNSPIIN